MDTEPLRRLFREYLWFALLLLAVLMSAATQKSGNTTIAGDSAAILTVGTAPH
jgi:hypothetical protein